jgi:hypothetical protein
LVFIFCDPLIEYVTLLAAVSNEGCAIVKNMLLKVAVRVSLNILTRFLGRGWIIFHCSSSSMVLRP